MAEEGRREAGITRPGDHPPDGPRQGGEGHPDVPRGLAARGQTCLLTRSASEELQG